MHTHCSYRYHHIQLFTHAILYIAENFDGQNFTKPINYLQKYSILVQLIFTNGHHISIIKIIIGQKQKKTKTSQIGNFTNDSRYSEISKIFLLAKIIYISIVYLQRAVLNMPHCILPG